jgi:hypothetical protein
MVNGTRAPSLGTDKNTIIIIIQCYSITGMFIVQIIDQRKSTVHEPAARKEWTSEPTSQAGAQVDSSQ